MPRLEETPPNTRKFPIVAILVYTFLGGFLSTIISTCVTEPDIATRTQRCELAGKTRECLSYSARSSSFDYQECTCLTRDRDKLTFTIEAAP
jgi:hypothetical protein